MLDSPPEEAFDRITRLASKIVRTPTVLISLVDSNRQWFKSRVGLDATETPREHAFCAHAILGNDVMIVPDASKDERFAQNPLVTDAPEIRFYAGAPLMLTEDIRLGTLCAIDSKPRDLTNQEAKSLRELAEVVVDELKLRRSRQVLAEANADLEKRAQELSIANQGLEQFAYMASHDLRAPLKTIINMADIALLDHQGNNPAPLQHIRNAAAGLEEMVVGYLRLSKLARTHNGERLLSKFVADALAHTGAAIDIKVKNDVMISCDCTIMTQVFSNLIENAATYSSGNRMSFDATSTGDDITIHACNPVCESVPVDDSIFAPFRRMTEVGEGTGLGLAIVERAAQLHSGSVTATCENHMFCVHIRIPQ